MATTDIHVRDARDRLIDLLGMGQTYPLRDLAVSDVKLTVAYNTIAKIPIEDSQKGVLYQLHHKHELVEGTETGKEGSDVGETIVLETYKIQEDTTFEILTGKLPWYLLSADLELYEQLDRGEFPEKLREVLFTDRGISFSDQVAVKIDEPDSVWKVQDQGNDQTYIIKNQGNSLAIYRSPDKEAYLHKTATVKVGLNSDLRAWIPDVPYLDPTLESPSDIAPRIINYGRSVNVEIENSQEGVDYKLVYFRVAQNDEGLEEVDLSVEDVRGDLHNIIITTQPVYEDTDIRIRATKTFDPSEERDSQTVLLGALFCSIGIEHETDLDGGTISEALLKVFVDQNFPLQNPSVEGQSPLWLISNSDQTSFTVRKKEDHLNIYRDTVLPLKVRANPALPVSVDPTPIIDYNNVATIKIVETQRSTNYQLYIRPIPDREFVHKVIPDIEVIKVSVEGEPDVQVRKPAEGGLSIIPEGYIEWGDAQQGTGGDLELKGGSLTDDSLVIVRAQKYHQASSDPQTAQRMSSAVRLEQAAVILVRPDPAPPLRVRVLMEGTETSGDIQVFDGQPGIFYYFRQIPEDKEFEWPAYFHKRDDRDKSLNKGLDQLKLGIDFVVAADPPSGEVSVSANLAEIPPEPPHLQTAPLPTGTILRIRAVKAQTRVASPLEHSANIPSCPEVIPEKAVVDHGKKARIQIKTSRTEESYQLLLDGNPLAEPVKGTGGDLFLETGELKEDTTFELLIKEFDKPIIVERVLKIAVMVR